MCGSSLHDSTQKEANVPRHWPIKANESNAADALEPDEPCKPVETEASCQDFVVSVQALGQDSDCSVDSFVGLHGAEERNGADVRVAGAVP